MQRLLSRLFHWKVLTNRMIGKRTGWWRRGIKINTVLTTRCPLDCSYCPMYLYGPVKKYEEVSWTDWARFFERFPHWITLVYVSGGEPSLYRDIVPLVNWLLNRGHFVIVFTNLWKPERFLGIKKSWRLAFYPTLHYCDDKDRFMRGVRLLESYGYYVKVQEFDASKRVEESKGKELWDASYFTDTDDTIHAMPDTSKSLNLFIGCVEGYRA